MQRVEIPNGIGRNQANRRKFKTFIFMLFFRLISGVFLGYFGMDFDVFLRISWWDIFEDILDISFDVFHRMFLRIF